MSSWVEQFRNASSGKKKQGGFTFQPATDLNVGSYIPYGIPSGIPQLDLAVGRPGWPAGRMGEVFGFEHVGKTSLVLKAGSQCQRMGGFVVWIDAERAFSKDWARTNGCDPSHMDLGEASTIEDMFAAVDDVLTRFEQTDVEDRPPLLIAVDSVTAVPSKEMDERDFNDVQRLGSDARAIRIGMRKINPRVAQLKATVLFINHSIAQPNSYTGAASAGGHALKFNAGVRVQLARTKTMQEGEDTEKVYRGIQVGITVEKNRIGKTSSRKFSCYLLENGFDLHENLFDAFQQIDVLERVNKMSYLFKPTGTKLTRGEWKTFVDEHTQGADKAYEWFLKKATEMGEIVPYGGEVHRP